MGDSIMTVEQSRGLKGCETNSLHGVEAAPILAIHRGDDGYIGLMRKVRVENGQTEQFENLCSIKVAEFRIMFPAIQEWLVEDGFFTVNSMYRAAPFASKVTGLPAVWRREKHLRYLNTCYVDLDVGRPHSDRIEQRQTWRDATALAGNLMDAGLLPQASIFARSGRGVYIFWLLRDEQAHQQPPRAWPQTLVLYKRINRAISARLAHVAADPRAFDGARVLRIPGTRHSQSGQRAMYQIQANAKGQGYTYTLRELADFFDIREIVESLPPTVCKTLEGKSGEEGSGAVRYRHYGRLSQKPGSMPNRVRGAQIRGSRRAHDLVVLEQWRDGWKRGRRRFHLALYVSFLRSAGISQSEALDALEKMAGNCRPPYPSDANDTKLPEIVRQAYTGSIKIYSNASLLDWLGITSELARELNLLTILPAEVSEERKVPCGGKRGQRREARQACLNEYIKQQGLKSLRALVNMLAQQGIKTNHQTVSQDLIALGYGSGLNVPSEGKPPTNMNYSLAAPGTSPANDMTYQPPLDLDEERSS